MGIGVIFKRLGLDLEVIYNRRKPVRFDSLYALQPFPEFNLQLSPPVYRPDIKLKIRFPTFDFQLEHARVDSFIYWTDLDQDSLLEPKNRDVSQNVIHFHCPFQWASLKNSLNLVYQKTLPGLDLIPVGSLTDSLLLLRNRFGLEVILLWIMRRSLGDYPIAPIFNVSSRVSYRLGLFNLFLAIDNIFDKKFEALPYRFHKGRRYSLGCSLSKTI